MERGSVYTLLDMFYRELGTFLDKSSYAFKGGYILGKYFGIDYRGTSDLDMSIADIDVFDSIKGILIPLLEKLKVDGIIYDYKFKEPKVQGNRNISGGVKVFRLGKLLNTTKKYKYTDVDISIHPLDIGGIITNPDGFSQYSAERMLGDKVSVLYSTVDTILRRIRDVYDVYCIVQVNCGNLDKQECLRFCESRGVDIFQRSTFENILSSNPSILYEGIESFLLEGDRVQKDVGSYIKPRNVLEWTAWFLGYLRS